MTICLIRALIQCEWLLNPRLIIKYSQYLGTTLCQALATWLLHLSESLILPLVKVFMILHQLTVALNHLKNCLRVHRTFSSKRLM